MDIFGGRQSNREGRPGRGGEWRGAIGAAEQRGFGFLRFDGVLLGSHVVGNIDEGMHLSLSFSLALSLPLYRPVLHLSGGSGEVVVVVVPGTTAAAPAAMLG